jgi:hypothetical protein
MDGLIRKELLQFWFIAYYGGNMVDISYSKKKIHQHLDVVIIVKNIHNQNDKFRNNQTQT